MGGAVQSSPRKSSYNFQHELPSKFLGTTPTPRGKNQDKEPISRTNAVVNHFLMPNSYVTDLHRVTTNALHSRNKGSSKFRVRKGSRSSFALRRWKYGNEGYEIINEQSSDENDYERGERVCNLGDIFDTVESLEKSLRVSRSLEAEQWLRYSKLKAHDMITSEDLKKAHKLNKNMLNLFRQSVTDIRFGNNDALPESLKREVQRSWHQKYDALLKKNEQLEKKVTTTDFIVKEKDKQIETLQQKLLDLAETQIKREGIIKKVNSKYVHLKNRKQEQEALFRGTIESLQAELRRTRSDLISKKSETTIPSRDSLLARELRRNERLAHENSTLRALLHEARRVCRNNSRSFHKTFMKTTDASFPPSAKTSQNLTIASSAGVIELRKLD